MATKRTKFAEAVARCCGIDVDKRFLWASSLLTEGKRCDEESKTFLNNSAGVAQLRQWLHELQVTHVAFESTGVYWNLLFDGLDGEFDVLVGNSYHMKAMRGYKTDRGDGRWIATLLRMGSLRGSFIPSAGIRALREQTRMYRNMVDDQTRVKNRIVKTLRQGGVTLDSCLSSLFTKSGEHMVCGIIEGLTVEEVAERYRGRRTDIDLGAALPLPMPAIYHDNLRRYWEQYQSIRAGIEDLWSSICERAEPYSEQLNKLRAIHGIGEKTAVLVISEIGCDMSRFGSSKQFASWAGLCPGNNKTGGKRKSGLTRKGNRYLRFIVIEAAWASVRVLDSPFRDYYYSIKKRMGGKKAIVAVAHKLLRVIYAVLRNEDGFSTEHARSIEKRNRRIRNHLRCATEAELRAEMGRRQQELNEDEE